MYYKYVWYMIYFALGAANFLQHTCSYFPKYLRKCFPVCSNNIIYIFGYMTVINLRLVFTCNLFQTFLFVWSLLPSHCFLFNNFNLNTTQENITFYHLSKQFIQHINSDWVITVVKKYVKIRISINHNQCGYVYL